ncbi:MAG: hypothetical protein PVI97_16205 [Candidatus Thiodiazotropha sp.]|jgi:hypothetical protein
MNIKTAWEKYLVDQNDKQLLRSVKANSLKLPEGSEYPFAHRICDINLCGQAFRVVRLADVEESVFIYPCDTPSFDTAGVPYWLKGAKLREWVRLEEEQESDEDYEPDASVNWEKWR